MDRVQLLRSRASQHVVIALPVLLLATTTVTTATTASKTELPAVSTANVNDASKETAADCNVQGAVSVNELLAYISFYRNAASQSALLRVCSSFYTAAEISAAKKCLIANFRDLMESSMLVTERRSSSSRSAHEAELEDIVGIFDYLDSKDLLGCVSFTAANMNRLPGGYAPESINICNVAETQSKLDARWTTCHMLCKNFDSLHHRIVFQTRRLNQVTLLLLNHLLL